MELLILKSEWLFLVIRLVFTEISILNKHRPNAAADVSDHELLPRGILLTNKHQSLTIEFKMKIFHFGLNDVMGLFYIVSTFIVLFK